LEKLVAPIALYADSLIATMLPASVYPLEIVQAARFVADTNNLAKLDAQPWDNNVKAVARVPAAIKKLNDDLTWTMELGDAFLAQDKDVMDAIQSMRGKAQKAGTLQTTPQQIVTVTNLIVEKTVEQKVVVVTNTVVQIQPSNPQEELVAPIALYPDPLIATILPAAVYPLEIVQAAFFLEDTNNLPNLDAQPWDENVKAVAHVPAVIQKMNADLGWTITLGEAFLAQDKEVLEAIQNMRAKAQKAGTLQTTPQQTVVVTNLVSKQTVEQKVVVVTNTVVQIQPANPQVVYVPTYNPATVYYPPPAAAAPDPVGSLVTFGAAIAVGAVIANNCDWSGGAVYVGHGGVVVVGGGGSQGNINVNGDVNVNRGNVNSGNVKSGTTASTQKWQPNQSRLSTSSATSASTAAGSADARGWSSPGASTSTTSAGGRSATGTSASRSSTGTPSANRSGSSPGVSQSKGSSAANSAFGGASGGSGTRSASSRGASSRSSGGRSGGGGGGRR
jgi:hypothetical protein